MQNPQPQLEIQFGPQGQNITLNGPQVNQIQQIQNQNPFIWNGNPGGNTDERAIISILDRTITSGNADPLQQSFGVINDFLIKTTAIPGTYKFQYSNTVRTFNKISTITLKTPTQNDPVGMMRVRIEAQKI